MQMLVGMARRGRRIRTLVVRGALAALGLGSLATVHTADAALSPGTSVCSLALSADACKIESYRSCPGMQEQCTPILQSGFQGSWSGTANRPQYQYLDDTNAVVGGKLKPRSMAPEDVSIPSFLSSYAAIEARYQAYAQSNTVSPSSEYTRAPTWIPSRAIASCGEYVYEKYYSYMRFVDAANSCKQDEGCVVDMAYARSPYTNIIGSSNIADRTLSGRGASNVPLPPIPMTQGVVPKNGFYLGGILLTPQLRSVLAAAYPTWSATLDEVAARAYAGSNYYKWGSPAVYGVPPVRAYTNEFAFHKAMRDATRSIPVVEGRANFRRTEHFERLLSDWYSTAYCHGLGGSARCMNLPVLRQKGVLERIGGDPWIRTHILGDEALRYQAVGFALDGKAMRLDATGATLSAIDFLNVASTLGGGGMPVSGTVSNVTASSGSTRQALDPKLLASDLDPELDPTPLWNSGFGMDLNIEWYQDPPVAQAGSATPRLDCSVEASKSEYRLLACQATNALLDEIARDNNSCFDKGYAGCDWLPSMFVERFHRSQQYMTERAKDYASCMRWTGNSFGTMPSTAKANFQEVEKYIEDRREMAERLPAPAKLTADQRVQSFGETKSESVTLGDKDSFGGGYSYLAAWKSKPVKRMANGTICRMDFTADAEFKAWASVYGEQRDVVDFGAHLRANKDDDGKAEWSRKLIVNLPGVDSELIADRTVPINVAPDANVRGEEHEFTIFSGTYPLPYGFYVDIEAGVELSAGVIYAAVANVPAKGNCSAPETISATAMLTPYAMVSLYGSASGGWMGIIEAGLEAELDLVKAELPILASGSVTAGSNPQLRYDLEATLRVKTLSGRIEACGCFLVFCGCTEVASWPGVTLASADLFEPIHGQTELIGL